MVWKIKGDPNKIVKLPVAPVGSGGGFRMKQGSVGGGGAGGGGGTPYIISGLEQSHWLASDAVVSGGRVTSVPDQSGVEPLLPIQAGALPYYSATGWSLNGKTLPTVNIQMPSLYGNGMYSNAWGAKINGYSGAWTVAVLVKMYYNSNINRGWNTSFSFYDATSGLTIVNGDRHEGPSWEIYGGINNLQSWRRKTGGEFRKAYTPTLNSGTPRLWVYEYSGNTQPDFPGQIRWWENGTLASISGAQSSPVDTGTYRSAITVTQLGLGMAPSDNQFDALNGGHVDFAQFHIYKGALTDEQRNDLTTYLKGISGIV